MLRIHLEYTYGGPFAFYSGLQEDFTPISTYLMFSSTVTKQCITISISDDTLTEFPEDCSSGESRKYTRQSTIDL